MLDEIMLDVVEGASRRLSQGKPNGSYIEVLMDNAKEWELEKDDLICVAAALIAGGATTTASVIQFVALLTTCFPEAQRRVQEELDQVIGPSRHPVIEDMPDLPYLNAFVKEINRFRPIAPTSIPHRTLEDIVHEGHVIPKDTALFMNIWGVYHSTELYDNPEKFEPERFLRSPYGTKAGIEQTVNEEALKKLDLLHFGAGRRKCPGLPMAVDSVALVTANLLWAFSFSPSVNEDGSTNQPDPWAYISGLTNDPLPFKFTVKPRTQRHADYIRHSYMQSSPTFELFERELSDEDKKYVEEIRSRLA
ncbi:hypothetical protein FRC03_002782 [Tulasnella sp. 419]|nr:hypothetical protein FRC03_002782 [Tulasnella sp. 419]